VVIDQVRASDGEREHAALALRDAAAELPAA
jgi:hypothetical protein